MRAKQTNRVINMVQLNKFDGNLLHNIIVSADTYDEATLAATTSATTQVEFEIFPASCLQLCIGSLPILKGIRAYFHLSGGLADIALIAGEGFMMNATIWNLDDSFIPADIYDNDPHFECLGGCEFIINEGDGTATLDIEVIQKVLQKSYGNDGVLLRPSLSAEVYLENNTASGINKDLFKIVLELDIDWVPISEAEWDEYLRELWLVQSFGD